MQESLRKKENSSKFVWAVGLDFNLWTYDVLSFAVSQLLTLIALRLYSLMILVRCVFFFFYRQMVLHSYGIK